MTASRVAERGLPSSCLWQSNNIMTTMQGIENRTVNLSGAPPAERVNSGGIPEGGVRLVRAPEGPKASSPGQAQRSPGLARQRLRALKGRKTKSNLRSSPPSFYRPCRGSILFHYPTPGCAALARGYYLWPLRGPGCSKLRGPGCSKLRGPGCSRLQGPGCAELRGPGCAELLSLALPGPGCRDGGL